MMLFHRLDASAMVLIWNLGTAALVVSLGCLIGRRVLTVGQRSGLDDLLNRRPDV